MASVFTGLKGKKRPSDVIGSHPPHISIAILVNRNGTQKARQQWPPQRKTSPKPEQRYSFLLSFRSSRSVLP
jgi:hypothetical protein